MKDAPGTKLQGAYRWLKHGSDLAQTWRAPSPRHQGSFKHTFINVAAARLTDIARTIFAQTIFPRNHVHECIQNVLAMHLSRYGDTANSTTVVRSLYYRR